MSRLLAVLLAAVLTMLILVGWQDLTQAPWEDEETRAVQEQAAPTPLSGFLRCAQLQSLVAEADTAYQAEFLALQGVRRGCWDADDLPHTDPAPGRIRG